MMYSETCLIRHALVSEFNRQGVRLHSVKHIENGQTMSNNTGKRITQVSD